jgi:putative ABC transport system substrate-binding protein
VAAFKDGLGQHGFVEGQNVVIKYRWAEDQYNQLPDLAADLVRNQVAIIIAAGGSQTAFAAKYATKTTPILFMHGGDPIQLGLVASLNRPEKRSVRLASKCRCRCKCGATRLSNSNLFGA